VKIAFLGGSFNPVHIGHLALADALRVNLGYDRVILVPANIPPHKELAGGATPADRLEMLRLAAVEANDAGEWLLIDDCELLRGGVSYTVDTARYLAEKYRSELEGRLALAIGEDLVEGFDSWNDVPGLLSTVDVIVARRPGGSAKPFAHLHSRLENALLPISSSDIRSSIAGEKSWRYLVPDPVYRYIVSHTLYEPGKN
jgi:nicotinate-nucleotide adenylyltransferase